MKDSDEAIDIPFGFDSHSSSENSSTHRDTTLDDSGSDDPGEYLRIEANVPIYNLIRKSREEDILGVGDLSHRWYEMNIPLPENIYLPKTNEFLRVEPMPCRMATEDSE